MRALVLAVLVTGCTSTAPAESETREDAAPDVVAGDVVTGDVTTEDVTIASDTRAQGGVDSTVTVSDTRATSDVSKSEVASDVGVPTDTKPVDAGPVLDPDGVAMLHPTNPAGKSFRLGTSDPNSTANFEIERGTTATKKTSGALVYWNVPSHALNYASGGTGWTTRFHIYASGTKTQLYTWKTQNGWLATPDDLKNQEFTVYVRGHVVLDAPRAAFSLKIRGGRHTTDGDLGSCTMMLFAGKDTSGIARFGKELTHPTYDYVKLVPALPDSLTDNVWIGLKLVSYQRPTEPTKVQYFLYADVDPFDAAGKPKNGWKLFSSYEDVEGKDTGDYTKLADWGGMITTLRTDGLRDVDFAWMSVREITLP